MCDCDHCFKSGLQLESHIWTSVSALSRFITLRFYFTPSTYYNCQINANQGETLPVNVMTNYFKMDKYLKYKYINKFKYWMIMILPIYCCVSL